jgi:hypothetical protein
VNDPCDLIDPLGLECNLLVYLDSSFLPMSKTDQKAFQNAFFAEMNRIFGDVSVGIQQTSAPSSADFTVTLAGTFSGNSGKTPSALVLGQGGPGTGAATLFTGAFLLANPYPSPSEFGQAAGEEAVHEFGHTIYPGQAHPASPDETNVFQWEANPFTDRLDIPAANKPDIQNYCNLKHPPKNNNPGTGNSSGGGGGGGGVDFGGLWALGLAGSGGETCWITTTDTSGKVTYSGPCDALK